MSKWYEEAVFYHMYPIGMTGAPRQNTQEEVTHRFPELMEWLPYVQSLGCTAIYIGPLFESTSHGYDTRDYKLIDRRLGDNEDFKCFCGKGSMSWGQDCCGWRIQPHRQRIFCI